MYRRHNYRCFVKPENRATQRAHIIGNTKANRKKYGNDIIDSLYNWLPAGDLKANALIDAGNNEMLMGELYTCILNGWQEEIERLVRENIKRKEAKIP